MNMPADAIKHVLDATLRRVAKLFDEDALPFTEAVDQALDELQDHFEVEAKAGRPISGPFELGL